MNWTLVTENDLRAVVAGNVVDAALASAVPGQTDPVLAALTDAVLVVRAAVAAGNALDADPATVPGSLRALAARWAAFALLERLRIDLSVDQRATRAADLARLERLREEREHVEAADVPLPPGGGVETVVYGAAGHGREELRGI